MPGQRHLSAADQERSVCETLPIIFQPFVAFTRSEKAKKVLLLHFRAYVLY